MNIANKLTFFRLILAPIFFITYLLPSKLIWTIPVFWVLFIVSGITDLLDGLAARKLNQVSDFGKLFDPFADTLVHITYFLCFVIDGLFPAILFLIIVYREFGILFIRNLMLKYGTTLGASTSGKIKTFFYIIAAGAALLISSFERLDVFITLLPYFKIGAKIMFAVSVILAVISFVEYFIEYWKIRTNRKVL